MALATFRTHPTDVFARLAEDHLRPLQQRPEFVSLLGQASTRHHAFGRRFPLSD